ncbi:MAG: aldehyde-activating protein [Rhodospirillaceae bacterium]|nr:aldehyde-activating protein [Rhodospirillaceae bacterium]|tara:strand:+ start:176 stop:622 length:447 start_codon:yes stop_codon:yes gene_type:complete
MKDVVTGGCHCGNLSVVFHGSKPFEELPVRACQCSFCRKHNVRATADPQGSLEIIVEAPAKLSRYRMGLGITDYLICADCGVYVAATMEDPEKSRTLATCVVNALDIAPGCVAEPQPTVYDGETAVSRLERRRQRWMTAVVLYSTSSE